MKCQEEDGCPNDAVGVDIAGSHLCAEHLAFSRMVQLLINRHLDAAGHPELVPENARLPEEKARDN